MLLALSASAQLTSFPADFLFGSASASYQVEGGWNADGKGESIWDRLVHTEPNRVLNGDTGDVAADSYHKYAEDVQLLKAAGVSAQFGFGGTRRTVCA